MIMGILYCILYEAAILCYSILRFDSDDSSIQANLASGAAKTIIKNRVRIGRPETPQEAQRPRK